MVKHSAYQVAREDNLSALIVGPATSIQFSLINHLQEYKCQVHAHVQYTHRIHQTYNYIFQFGDVAQIHTGLQHLKKDGKLLFIELNEEHLHRIPSDARIRVLRIGHIDLWSEEELTEKIQKTLFTSSYSGTVDCRKLPTKSENNILSSHLIHETSPFQDTGNPMSFSSHAAEEKKNYLLQHKTFPSYTKTHKHAEKDVEVAFESRKINVRKTFRIRKIIGVGLVFFALCFFVYFLGFTYVSYVRQDFDKVRHHLDMSAWKEARDDLLASQTHITRARFIINLFSAVFFPLRETRVIQDVTALLESANSVIENTNQTLLFLSNTRDDTSTRAPVLFSKDGLNGWEKTLENMVITFSRMEDSIKNASLPFLPKESLLQAIAPWREKLLFVHDVLPVVKQLFLDGTKTYLVLFQNNMELRPTGGFIGSYGIFRVESETGKEGIKTDLKIYDVYTADGQLKGHVEPPLPIRKYLAQPNWFLRDSNFDPDFAASSLQAAFFLQKETGIVVDGVIGINLFLVQNILKATGPLTLADFNQETVTADNLFSKAQSYSEKNFFPGSTQKKDFLTAVAANLREKLLAGKNISPFELLASIKTSLDEKHVLLFSKNEETQDLIEEKGWGGRITQVRCSEGKTLNKNIGKIDPEHCFSDYLSIIEANLGVNKANYFITKSVAVEKKLDSSGAFSTVITLSYENKSIPEVGFGGPYVNYLRILTPSGVTLTNATINTVPILSSVVDVEPYGLDKTSIGLLVHIAAGNKATVRITYTIPRKLSNTLTSYQLSYQKQGGEKVSPFLLSFTFPKEFVLSPANFTPSSTRSGELFFTSDTSVDRIFALKTSSMQP